MENMKPPTYRDVLRAERRIRPYLAPTPMLRYPGIDALIGTEVWIKREDTQPIGVFKVRGGLNLVSQLDPETKARGVAAASTGNHGQSVAYAAREFGVPATIVVPERANPGKVAAMKAMGADVLFHGRDFDFARRYCEELCRERGYRYIHAGDEPLLIAGVGTIALEMLRAEPDLDVLMVPLGGGSGAAAASIVAEATSAELEVIAVQSEASPSAYRSWQQGELVEAPNETFAEGLATGTSFALPQQVLKRGLSDFVLVGEDDLLSAMVWLLERAHVLSEGAGAAGLAGAYKLRERLAGKKVGIVLTGGNVSTETLRRALEHGDRMGT